MNQPIAFGYFDIDGPDLADDPSTLVFPTDRAVGVVMVRASDGGWVDHAPAYGRVSISPNAEYGLRWDCSTPFDREILERLPRGMTLLDLEWSDVNDDSITSALAFDLKELKLSHTRITDSAMPTIGLLYSLRSLSLRGTSVGDAGVVHLRGITQLDTLDLAATRITDETLEVLGKMKSLRSLNIDANPWPRITGRGLSSLTRLWSLSLSWTDLSDTHLAPIAEMKALRSLDLSGTRVTDIGLRMFDRLPLKSLTICATPGVTNVGMGFLRRMASLESLNLHDTGVDNLGVFDLWSMKPQCAVNGITHPQWQAGALAGRWAASEKIVGAGA